MKIRRLLLVDDEENVLKSLLRLLQGDNYEIFTASNGKEGLELIIKNKFQIVISDYRMPEMNGAEFLKQVRKISPDTIRLILTGYADIDIAVSAINEGHVYKFITKPWDGDLLKVTVKRALDFYDLIQEKEELSKELVKKNAELQTINKNLEKIVEERTQQLLHSEKMATLGQMAGQIGHEINNILQILLGRMELIKNQKVDNKLVEEFLKVISEQCNRLRIHTRNLLTFGRPVPPDFKNIVIKDTLEKTIDNLMYAGVLKYYKINKEYLNNLPLIYGDITQLDQIFTNLIINAHHAMEGNGVLTVALKLSDDNKFVEVLIKDTGKGIPEENVEKIFEPFFTTKPEGMGTGLGLSVVKKIMESHKGYITVDSKVNSGTTMILRFPPSDNN